MNYSRIFTATFSIFFISAAIFAQSAETTEKAKSKEQIEFEEKAYRLLSKTVDEAASLKLAENRIAVSIAAGSLFLEKDEKLARQIIRSAAAEFVALQSQSNFRFKADQPNYQVHFLNNLRGRLILSIPPKFAEFALEILLTTRSPELAENVRMYQQITEETGKNPNLSDYKAETANNLQNALYEIGIEQNIRLQIAKSDPQKWAETIREAFSKDLDTSGILNSLNELNKKDHDTAQKLLDEILGKLADADFSNSYGKAALTFAVYASFLHAQKTQKAAERTLNEKNKNLTFDEKSVRAIAANEIDYFSKEAETKDAGYFVQKAAYLKQILPERFRAIEKKYETARKNVYGGYIESAETAEKLGDDPTLEQIIENSEKLDRYRKEKYYQNAVGKLLETESEEKIAAKLERIGDADDREKALDYLKSLAAKKNGEQNSLSQAMKAIGEIKSKNERIAALVNLAISYDQKKTEESRKIAQDLMDEARKSVKEIPETDTEYEAIFPVISGYAQIDPAKAFDLIAPIARQSNELIEAFVVYMNYQDKNFSIVKDREMIFAALDSYSYKARFGAIIRTLAQNDFERTENLVNNFQRQDARIMAKLVLAESILSKQGFY